MSNSPNWSPLAGDPRLWNMATLTVTRSLARIDPDLFVSFCFRDPSGRPINQSAVHSELQAFLSRHGKALVELPRDHGKSFQVCCRVLWELGCNAALRVKVVCATEAVAAERSRFLRDAIDNNPMVRHVFPDLRRGSPWAAEAFAVDRPADVIGPSVAAFGVGAGSTGTRADLLVCDDIVDVRALHSKAERGRTAAYFQDNLMNLLEPDGRFWGLCTPWHPDDLNARLKANGAYALFRRSIGANLEPVWPERWTPELLAQRRSEIGAASFARGYHLLPVAEEETPIRGEWVRFWTEPAEYDAVVLSVDPAVSASEKADASALVVLGRVPGEPTVSTVGCSEIRVLASSARRVAAPELVNLIDEFDRTWNPGVILFETNAAFLGIKDLLARHARFGPKLKGVTQSRDKAARVAAFSVAVENGAVRLKGDGAGGVDPGQRALF
ncbi:MAG TPA: hypothetical protein VMZ71_07730, partial [Gemmataceae bacterium]|nr:hypothetical protein [Gemmataceae bacterium]